ncbi:MAG TPA: aminoglycoside phosphotransferase family protein [Candidatus Heimdallarchaeota archaeon]|nr:aminoglycoside phosphotransferase family protein [Candidatus Heimdallarchaeota archaeon]
MADEVSKIASQFNFAGECLDARPYGAGHIHDTTVVRFRNANGSVQRYILQRLNTTVFQQPERLMENIERITVHLSTKIRADGGDPMREALHLIPARDGKAFVKTGAGEYWRAFHFIERAQTYDTTVNLGHVAEVAKAYGRFLKLLGDFPLQQLHETIPDFHHTERRCKALMEAAKRDTKHRVRSAKSEIGFVENRAEQTSILVDLLEQGGLPTRVVHNDTKLGNVLIDDGTGRSLCVIDLDTVMPGLSLYDFGDLVRSAANPAAEDERGLSKVGVDLAVFERCVEGYLEGVGGLLTPSELDLFPFSAKLIALELGMRFLTDYLNGDVYFKIHREGQNLDRCRVQFKLVEEMETKHDRMARIVETRKSARPFESGHLSPTAC